MLNSNTRSHAKRASLAAAVLLASCGLVPSSEAAIRGGIAQRPPLAESAATCATGHFYDLVMPDGVNVLAPCPGTSSRVFKDLEQVFGTRVAHSRILNASRGGTTHAAREYNRSEMVSGPKNCRPGDYWLMGSPDDGTNTIVACE
jgi:hypothetical protein